MLALMLYIYLKGDGISQNSIECGLLFYYWCDGLCRASIMIINNLPALSLYIQFIMRRFKLVVNAE